MIKIFFTLFFLFLKYEQGSALGCYECQSGGTFPRDEYCEVGSRYAGYQYSCVPRDSGGQAPGTGLASYCVKVIGTEGDGTQSGRPVVMRGCSSNFRTECKDAIVFNGRTVKGCIYSCNNGEFCNTGSMMRVNLLSIISSIAFLIGLKAIVFK